MTSTRDLDRSGAALIAGCLLLLGVVAAIVGYVEVRRQNPPATGEMVILLDRTDRLSTAQATRAVDELRQLEVAELQPGDHVAMFVLGGGESGGLERVFSGRFPGLSVNPLFGNERQVSQLCDSSFTAPLRAAAWQALQGSESPRSPILEAVKELSEQPELRRDVTRRTLILISNLMENMPGLSFYRDHYTFAKYRVLNFSSVRADLRGVRVSVIYLPSGPDALEGSGALREFWRAYFAACGADSVQFQRL